MAAYAVFLREKTTNPEEMQIYASSVRPTMEGHQVTMLTQHGEFEVLEGEPVEAVVILKFPTMTDARTWYHGTAYQDVAKHRLAGATFRVVLTEGIE